MQGILCIFGLFFLMNSFADSSPNFESALLKSSQEINLNLETLKQLDKEAGSVIILDTVVTSNNQSWGEAQRSCRRFSNLLGLLSNDQIILSGSCQRSYDANCQYFYCYELSARAVVLQ